MSALRWQALGTTAELLVLGDERALALARAAVERWLEEVDRACSRFRADSELSQLNRAGGRAVRVSPTLMQATQLALRAARLTEGDVDPTVGEALELAGYDRDWSLIEADPERDTPAAAGGSPAPTKPQALPPPPASARRSTLQVPALRLRVRRRAAWTRVRVDRPHGTIALPRGVKLDLGATAKAWAADRSAEIARAASGCGVLVSLGGDIATSGECPAGGWRVHVTDDHRDGTDAPGQTIAIRGGGLATSSTFVRRWRLADRRSRFVPRTGYRSPIGDEPMHHIIDPATSAPARTPWRTVSVAAESCADANIAATAAIVRGERALAWLAQAGLPARLVANDGQTTTVGSWPREQRQPAARQPATRQPQPSRPAPSASQPSLDAAA